MKSILEDVRNCEICKKYLPNFPKPIISISAYSRIIIIGQAPSRLVHRTEVPWNDRSGDRLRKWLSVTREEFYDNELFGIMPMAFCYPGTGETGDLPPRPECAPQWHQSIMDQMEVKNPILLLVGQYAMKYYLGNRRKKNLTETVRSYKEYIPQILVIPHPSPRNGRWLKKNPWFEEDVVPDLQSLILETIKKAT